MYEDLFASSNYLQNGLFDICLEGVSFNGGTDPSQMIYGRGALYFNPKIHPWLTIEGGLQTLTDSIYWLIEFDDQGRHVQKVYTGTTV